MKTATLAILSGMILLGASLQAQAENQWSKYQGVDSKKYQHKPSYPQNSAPYSNNLQHHRPYPQPFARPYPSRPRPNYSPTIQNGVSIQYQAPTIVNQHSQSYHWVNGAPNTARIESSNAILITDWQRLGLPAPPTGTYWTYEQGRYVLVPNR
ncbi:RcnB family protein [Acinetobacter albensis]|uniref:RcnB family protein n=1 Tax=Acinetobacter albensis TaxID=1673609 RepID=UPI001881308F|nr:RcnB family protein [Acinetobacter albensis]MBE9401498.1 RcnB family protein [Acinetobacter albensis]